MHRRIVVSALAVTALVFATAAWASMSPVVSAKLTGSAETPKGSPTGSGLAVVHLNGGTGRVCWAFSNIKGIGPALAAHIHKGKPGTAGPVVVPFGAKFSARGCITMPKAIVKAIEAHPNGYYVNVHTAKYPGGAIRGQLAAGMTG